MGDGDGATTIFDNSHKPCLKNQLVSILFLLLSHLYVRRTDKS